MRLRGLVLVGILGLAMSACASNNSEVDSLSATYGLPSTRVDLEAEDWVLIPAKSSVAVDPATPVTATFDDDVVSGIAPCNTYRGDFDLNGESVEITHIASSARACAHAVMSAESEYFTALRTVDTVDVDDNRLVLTGPGDVRLTFRAFDALDRLVGTWPIVNVATGDTIEGVLPGTNPSVTFADDGTLTLVTGCNDARGDWKLDGDQLTVGPLRQTKKLCSDPDGVMQQEAALTRALESAAQVQIAPTELMVLNAGGAISIVGVK